MCTVSDTSRVALSLRNLELIPVDEVARFHMSVDGSGSAELAVSVRGKLALHENFSHDVFIFLKLLIIFLGYA